MPAQRILEAGKRKAGPGGLATAVAHEIKNCLTGIRGCLQVLGQDFPDAAPQKQITGEILSDVARLDIAVKTLLLLATPSAPNPVPVSVNAVIQNVKTTLEAQWGSQLNIDFIPRTVPEVLIDPEQLGMALLNIAGRRIHATGGKASIVFAARARRDRGEVEISMVDKDANPVGDPGGPVWTFGDTGAGLGLAVGRIIIEGNKGRIDVSCAKGSGTAVCIMLKSRGRA